MAILIERIPIALSVYHVVLCHRLMLCCVLCRAIFGIIKSQNKVHYCSSAIKCYLFGIIVDYSTDSNSASQLRIIVHFSSAKFVHNDVLLEHVYTKFVFCTVSSLLSENVTHHVFVDTQKLKVTHIRT